MTLTDIRKLTESSRAKELADFRARYPYKLPKSHTDWRLLSALATMALACDISQAPDYGSGLHFNMWRAWAKLNAPVYCLGKDLLREFESTDTADLAHIVPANWCPPLPMFLLVPPCNSLKTPDGHEVPYILVSINHPALPSLLQSEHPCQITISMGDRSESTWVSGTGIYPGALINDGKPLGSAAIDSDESKWMESMTAIALQSLLVLSYESELVEVPIPQVRSRGTANRRGRQTDLSPRWIGRQYKSLVPLPNRGTHASPRTHWRKGFWRNQACSPKRAQRKLVRVKPTRVNG